ncbi:MAG TPA: DUF3048 domain-containing protein [Acidimicrobiia bacterium]|jgi:hypothetical protein|nr:DUF3048 domain-containing protein [Acidimicrobiia bacterium]
MRLRWLILLVSVAVVAAACGGGGTVAAKHKKLPPTTVTTAGPPVAPLTGLPDNAAQALTRPALSIKIENTPEARPQTGLDVADVVYEEITEGNITRFIAVYNSTIPPIAGPVRSGRAMDPDILIPLGGIFAYSGGIQQTVDAISRTPGVNVIVDTGSDPALFRDHTKSAPHNLYAHADQLLARGGKPVPPSPLFHYLQQGAQFAGDGVKQFSISYDTLYRPTYTYDPASNTWKRSIGGTAFMDTDGQQVAPTNVIVQFVGCCLNSPEGAKDVTVGSGDITVFSSGRMTKGTWRRSSNTQPIQYFDSNGSPLQLTPGRTWVEFFPVTGEALGVFGVTPDPTRTIPVTTPTTAPTTTTTKKKR